MSDRSDASFWTAIKQGDYVNLNDYQSFAEGGTGGIDYRVRDIRRIAIRDRDTDRVLAEYHLHDLEREGGAVACFAVVRAGDDLELRVYFVPDGFMVGSRDDLIDHGHTWFFLPPPNPDDFISSQLEYAPFPDVPPIEEEGKSTQREYEMAGFGHPVYGSYRRGSDEVPVIITEYATNEESLNPLLLILEERWMRPDGSVPEEGGFLTPMLGCVVEPESAEVFPA
jgi:hypothetical protein